MTTAFEKRIADLPEEDRKMLINMNSLLGYNPGQDMFNRWNAAWANLNKVTIPQYASIGEIVSVLNNKSEGWDNLYHSLDTLRIKLYTARKIVNGMYKDTMPDNNARAYIRRCAAAIDTIDQIMPKAKAEPEKIDPVIDRKADEIIASGKVLDYISASVERSVIGNKAGIKLLIMALSQRGLENGNGIYVHLNGEMGGGKSAMTRRTLWHFPPEIVRDGGMSAKSLFYDNAECSMIYYIDDFNALNEETKSTLKNCLTNFRQDTAYRPVNRINGENQVVSLAVKARTSVIFSSVDSIADGQLMDRLVPLPTDHDPTTKAKVHQYYTDVDSGKLPDLDGVVDEQVAVSRQILRKLTCNGIKHVNIPWLDAVEWPDSEITKTRNYGVFRDLIKLSALLAQGKRRIDDRGWIEATYEDFYVALDVYAPSDTRRTMMATKMSEGPLKVFDYLAKHRGQGFTQAEIVEATGINQANLSRYLKTLMEMSQIVQDDGVREHESEKTGSVRMLPVKVYALKGNGVKSSLNDHPIQLSQKCISSEAYKAWSSEFVGQT